MANAWLQNAAGVASTIIGIVSLGISIAEYMENDDDTSPPNPSAPSPSPGPASSSTSSHYTPTPSPSPHIPFPPSAPSFVTMSPTNLLSPSTLSSTSTDSSSTITSTASSTASSGSDEGVELSEDDGNTLALVFLLASVFFLVISSCLCCWRSKRIRAAQVQAAPEYSEA